MASARALRYRTVILTQPEWIALACAVVLLLLAGVWHLGGILTIKAVINAIDVRNELSVLVAFWGIALLHVSEIIIGAGAYGAAIHWLELGYVSGGYGDSAGG